MKKLTLVLVTLFVVLALVGPAFGSGSRADARRATTITYLASQDWVKQSEIDRCPERQ